MCIHRHFCAAEGLLASGDDAGVVKLWDCRAAPSKAASTITKNEDFIADLLSHDVSVSLGRWVCVCVLSRLAVIHRPETPIYITLYHLGIYLCVPSLPSL